MAMRSYMDPGGREWVVWEVAPKFVRRRNPEDRRKTSSTRPVNERRIAVRRRTKPAPELLYGWLCFESMGEKRRLTPVPPDWETCSPVELDAFRTGAVPVHGAGPISPQLQ